MFENERALVVHDSDEAALDEFVKIADLEQRRNDDHAADAVPSRSSRKLISFADLGRCCRRESGNRIRFARRIRLRATATPGWRNVDGSSRPINGVCPVLRN